MLHLSPDFVYTNVKRCLGARTNGLYSNAAPFTGFGVRPRETLARAPTDCLQILQVSADLAHTYLKHCLGANTTGVSAHVARASRFGIHSRNTALAQVPSACKCCTRQRIWRTLTWKHCFGASAHGVSANAAPASGFGVHPRETLPRRKYQRSVCKCCTCQRIWRTPT